VTDWILDMLYAFFEVCGQMAPYLLAGFLIAGLLSVIISPGSIDKHLGGRGFLPVLKASAFGVPLPLCSCSVIPVAASLRRHGAGKGATTAFLVSTPQTGADSVAVTFSLLGPFFAVYRPLAALVSGIVGGIAVSLTEGGGVKSDKENITHCEHECCTHGPRPSIPVRILRYGLVTLPADIGPSLLAGLVIAAVITVVVPGDFFSNAVPQGPLQIVVMMAAGMPVYICATASVPIAAGLIMAGVSPGAAFALLMTGPATNGATIVTIWRIMGRAACLLYLATMGVAAFGGGLLMDSMITAGDVKNAVGRDWMPGWIKMASVVALALVLCYSFYSGLKSKHHEAKGDKCK